MNRQRAFLSALCAALIAALLAALYAGSQRTQRLPQAAAALTTEALAPLFASRFEDPYGKLYSFSPWRGKTLLVNFWATWCPPCVREMPELDRFQREFAPKNWKVVGLAVDEAEPVRKFLTKVGVGFDIGVAGFDGTRLAQALGNTTAGLPFTVLIDAQSRVRHRLTGATDLAQLAKQARRIHPG